MGANLMKKVCTVCHHRCELEQGKIGFCRARKNEHDTIVCVNYGKLTSIALDPIEKKPLYQFYPGSKILSVGSWGCNMACEFCQNYGISMTNGESIRTAYVPPEELVQIAIDSKNEGNIGIAFTYNEPLISFEYIIDCAKIAHQYNLQIVVVTNGCVSKNIAQKVIPHVDAFNIDLKSFSPSFYKRMKGDLDLVKEFITLAYKTSHVELTTLIIPNLNDSLEEMYQIASWIASINEDIPFHISRFFPMWKMENEQSTPLETVYKLTDIARNYLKKVYTGNC